MKRKEIIFVLAAAIFLAVFISPFAASSPDGLERVADDKGFIEKGRTRQVFPAPLADYFWPGIRNQKLAVALSGLAGTLAVFIIASGLGIYLKRSRKT